MSWFSKAAQSSFTARATSFTAGGWRDLQLLVPKPFGE